MTAERGLEQGLRDWLREQEATPVYLADVFRVTSRTSQRDPSLVTRLQDRLGVPVANRRVMIVVIVGLLLAALVGTSLVAGAFLRERSKEQSVVRQPPCGSDAPNAGVAWTGRVRTDLADMPLIDARTDPRDTAFEGVDIVSVGEHDASQPHWSIVLAGFPPSAASLDPAETVIEYGLVFETTGDDVADFVVGINNDAPRRGDFRVWVTNLATGATQEKIGAPYGYPVEFSHPDERVGDSGDAAVMLFTFLRGTGDFALRSGVRYYAWASVACGVDVLAWDYAPDFGWLTHP